MRLQFFFNDACCKLPFTLIRDARSNKALYFAKIVFIYGTFMLIHSLDNDYSIIHALKIYYVAHIFTLIDYAIWGKHCIFWFTRFKQTLNFNCQHVVRFGRKFITERSSQVIASGISENRISFLWESLVQFW